MEFKELPELTRDVMQTLIKEIYVYPKQECVTPLGKASKYTPIDIVFNYADEFTEVLKTFDIGIDINGDNADKDATTKTIAKEGERHAV